MAKLAWIALSIATVVSGTARAADAEKDKKVFEARVFGSGVSIAPRAFNAQVAAGALQSFDKQTGLGIEVAFPVIPMVKVGARAEARYMKVNETATTPAVPLNPYYSSIQQNTAEAVLRLALLDTSFARLDVLGSIGVSNTIVDLRTASGEGTYAATDAQQKSNLISRYGASAGFGFGNVLLFVEGGYETNVVGDYKTLGNAKPIGPIDLSGNYVAVGLLFGASPGFVKFGGK